MAANNIQLNLILKAVDGMSVVVKSACYQSDSAFEKMNRSLEDTAGKFETAGKKAAVFGGAVLAASAVNLKTAGDFEAQMNNVSTLIDTNSENLKNMGNEVLKIGQNSPKALSDLTEGLYSIRSAGIEANQQFRVLSGSQMLSVAGLSTTAEAVDLATSAINAFNLKGREADGIYDMFFKVVKYGKTNISEFAQGFGGTAGVVASANIQLDEYSAAVAALTTSGLKASIAHTQLKAAIAGLSRGSKEQMAVFQKYGVKSFSQLVEVSGGMVNAFNRINRAVGGNQARLINLLGSVEAYNAVLSLTGANNKTYLQTLSDMRSGVDSLSEAYEKQTDGLNNRLLIMKNQAQILSIKLGTGLIPVVKAAGGAFAHLNSILDKIPDGFVNFISITGAGVGALSLLGGTGLMVAGSMIRNFILLRNVMRAASILSWAYPAILPLAGVALAVAAVGGAVVFAYNKFEGFRNHLKATWALVKLGGASLALLGNSFMNGALKVWGFISPAVRVAGVILSWVTPIGLAFRAIKGLSDIIGGLISKAERNAYEIIPGPITRQKLWHKNSWSLAQNFALNL